MGATTGERVLVIAANGVLGSLTAAVFERAGWEVLRGTRTGAHSPEWRKVDLNRPETLPAPFRESDIVVNPLPHPELAAERIVLQHGGVLINSSTIPPESGRRLQERSASARGTVVLTAAPTLTAGGDHRGAAVATLILAQALQDIRAHRPLPRGVFEPGQLL